MKRFSPFLLKFEACGHRHSPSSIQGRSSYSLLQQQEEYIPERFTANRFVRFRPGMKSHFTFATSVVCSACLLVSLCSTVDSFLITSKGLQTRLILSNVEKSAYPKLKDNFQKSTNFNESHVSKNRKLPKTSTKTIHIVARSLIFSFSLFNTLILTIPSPGNAAVKVAADATNHLQVGQKISKYFRSFGLPDLAILAIISALPVVELRGAVPVGVWMGIPIAQILPVCILGNMAPIVPLLFLLRNEKLKKIMSPILSRAEKKSASLGVGSIEKQWASLAAFVGVPLPGTGAWTGAMAAFLLGMPTAVALSSIFTGVVAAGCIMSAITLAGKKGGAAALIALAFITIKEFISMERDNN